jgi:hypothetical protein
MDALTDRRPPAGGRPRKIGRDYRWLFAYALGDTMLEIALGESPPVTEGAVSRGIARARLRVRTLDLPAVLARLGNAYKASLS